MMFYLIDNYDSFTYNLYHYLGEIGVDVEVFRNDAITVERILAEKAAGELEGVVLSPRPNLGIKTPVASSVIPLGATINMDGTGIYVGVVAIFAAQSLGIDLSIVDYGLIALTTTLVSIGTAAVPSASLFLLAAVLGVIGISGDQTALIVGFLLPFDRPLDMMRTVVNVTGDLAVATAVAKSEDEFDENIFRAAPRV